MSYLKSNYRKKAIDVSYTGIGGAFGNWIQGSIADKAYTDFEFGGFLFGSYASTSASGYVIISAADAFSSTFGVTMASNLLQGGGSLGSGSIGMKFIPWIFQDLATGGGVLYHLSATGAVAGDDSVVAIVTASASGAAFSGNVHFLFAGFIVSAPFALR